MFRVVKKNVVLFARQQQYRKHENARLWRASYSIPLTPKNAILEFKFRIVRHNEIHTICAVEDTELTDLGRNFGASHDGGEGALRLLHGTLKVVEFLLQQEAGHGRRKELGHTLGRAVCAVGGSEGVVDEQVKWRGQFLSER